MRTRLDCHRWLILIEGGMITVSLAHAQAHLTELLDTVAGGEDVAITRDGHPVARLSAVAEGKRPLRSLAAFRARLPPCRGDSAALLREMRDEER
jgi:prevent-host-death family protein